MTDTEDGQRRANIWLRGVLEKQIQSKGTDSLKSYSQKRSQNIFETSYLKRLCT